MERYAVVFTVKPGTEEQVAGILAGYAPIPTEAGAGTRLLNTTVFMKGNVVVRVMDVEGSLEQAVQHLSRQPEIRRVEQELNPYLEKPRDFSNPEGGRQFFQRALMTRVTHRVAGEPVAAAPEGGQ